MRGHLTVDDCAGAGLDITVRHEDSEYHSGIWLSYACGHALQDFTPGMVECYSWLPLDDFVSAQVGANHLCVV